MFFINFVDGKFLSIEDLEKWLDGELLMVGVLVIFVLICWVKLFELLEWVEMFFKMVLIKEKKF